MYVRWRTDAGRGEAIYFSAGRVDGAEWCNARIKPWQLLYWLWHRAQARGAADWVLAPPGILTLVATG